jgi:beta-lactamase regulating signal transducer with metallopeptidase domain
MSTFVLVSIAAKSVLCAGFTLLLLLLLRKRSAAERSRVAHSGLLAVLLLPGAALIVPNLEIAAPEAVKRLAEPALVSAGGAAPETGAALELAAESVKAAGSFQQSLELGLALVMLLPTVLLLLLTLFAVLRLHRLRARARVLRDARWLAALAAMQERFGFKHGTALLASDELSSPISWGILRPVILLDDRASRGGAEAEAIIAHELAHVASLDWAKLIVGRAATALFWFNPLVWLLARLCHELREEAADDAVLRTDFDRADYAQLLVGAARHEQRGVLLAANGVAPSRGSLRRRVLGVLDPNRRRALPGIAWSVAYVGAIFSLGTAVAAVEARIDVRSPAIELRAAQAARAVAAAAGQPLGMQQPPRPRAEPRRVRSGGSSSEALQTPQPLLRALRQSAPSASGLLADETPAVRGRVARALGEAGGVRHSGAIARLLQDPSAAVRLEAAHALGDLQDPATRPALETALDDSDPAVRAKAAWALKQLGEAETILERYGGD